MKTLATLAITIGILTSATAHAQTQLWKYTPPSSSNQPTSLAGIEEFYSDGSHGAALVVYYYINNGPITGYRFSWLSRTGKVRFTEEFPTAWRIVRTTPKVVILLSDDGRKLRRYSFSGSRAVMKETTLEADEELEGNLFPLNNAAGFFTLKNRNSGQFPELRRWKN